MKKIALFTFVLFATISSFANDIQTERFHNDYMAWTELENKDGERVKLRLNNYGADDNYYLHIIYFTKKSDFKQVKRICKVTYKGGEPTDLRFSNKRRLWNEKTRDYAYKLSFSLGNNKEASLRQIKNYHLKLIEYGTANDKKLKKIKIKNQALLRDMVSAIDDLKKQKFGLLYEKKMLKNVQFELNYNDTTKEAFLATNSGAKFKGLPLEQNGKVEVYHDKLIFVSADGSTRVEVKLKSKWYDGIYMNKPVLKMKFIYNRTTFELKESRGTSIELADRNGYEFNFD